MFPVDWRYQLEDVHGLFCPNYDITEDKWPTCSKHVIVTKVLLAAVKWVFYFCILLPTRIVCVFVCVCVWIINQPRRQDNYYMHLCLYI